MTNRTIKSRKMRLIRKYFTLIGRDALKEELVEMRKLRVEERRWEKKRALAE